MTESQARRPVVAERPAISIVIPNLDGAHWLRGCLQSIAAETAATVEVIIADDGSTDASRDDARRSGARFIESPRPRTGFAATANRGIRAATGTWILLLNNDTEVAPTAIAAILDAAARHPDVAMIAPLVLSLRDRERIDSAGMLLLPDGTARPRWHGRRWTEIPMREEEVLVPSGAAVVIHRDWLDRVGLLDEDLVSYLEDIDLGLRVRRAGGRAMFVPAAVVFHHFSGTTGALSPAKARLIERNHITVAARHLPTPVLFALPFWTIARWAVLAVTVLRARRRPSSESNHSALAMALAVLRGTLEGLLRLPRSLSERRALATTTTVDGLQWRRLLRTHRAHLSDYLRFGE